jgi:hypothetical protein
VAQHPHHKVPKTTFRIVAIGRADAVASLTQLTCPMECETLGLIISLSVLGFELFKLYLRYKYHKADPLLFPYFCFVPLKSFHLDDVAIVHAKQPPTHCFF